MVEPHEARRALAEVRERKQQVADRISLPAWHWVAAGALGVGFSAAVETRRPVLVTAGAILFAAGVVAIVALVILRAPVQVHRDLIGARGAVAIVSFVLTLVGLSLAVGFTLERAGVGYPGTWTSVFTAAGLIVGGPLLMRRLRAIMRARAGR